MTPLFRPQLLQKGDGSLHIQLSLGELMAELPVPKKYEDPKAEGFKEFFETTVREMTKGLKALHKDNKAERKRRNGFNQKRADRGTDPETTA